MLSGIRIAPAPDSGCQNWPQGFKNHHLKLTANKNQPSFSAKTLNVIAECTRDDDVFERENILRLIICSFRIKCPSSLLRYVALLSMGELTPWISSLQILLLPRISEWPRWRKGLPGTAPQTLLICYNLRYKFMYFSELTIAINQKMYAPRTARV